jgi:hypothetical protein
MSEHEPKGIYIYQPFGIQNKPQWESGRIYGVGGLPMGTIIEGLTKPEAESMLCAWRELQCGTPLELQVAMRDATLHMAVARLGGVVEGNPTGRHNFLQRIDELVEKEQGLN